MKLGKEVSSKEDAVETEQCLPVIPITSGTYNGSTSKKSLLHSINTVAEQQTSSLVVQHLWELLIPSPYRVTLRQRRMTYLY